MNTNFSRSVWDLCMTGTANSDAVGENVGVYD
jgi:hypothetical protein